MTMRKATFQQAGWILLLGLAGGLATVASAQQDATGGTSTAVTPGAAMTAAGANSVTGTVLSATESTLTITDADGRTRMFALDPAAPYGAAMNPGDRVRVHYDPYGSGIDLAENVQTLDLTAQMSPAEQRRETLAMSQPPTPSYITTTENLMAGTGAPSGTAGSPSTAQNVAPSAGSSATPSTAQASTPNTGAELPGTASPLPAVAAAGLILIGTGLGMNRILRRGARRG